ncbi:hypothetical protein ACFCYC_01195 [Streptomyces sp. NPDC056402]|uniref:hypothetical protein n=1 Tax=Streptomyces sp. NPDC056402 TaxID=3345810 RepID=UPI0035D59A73
MSHHYSINCLPCGHGDSILVEYGDRTDPSRILIDGGPASHYETLREALRAIPKERRSFELLVVSHIDTDHIDGALILLQDEDLGATFNDVWFNGWPQLESISVNTPPDVFAPQQGEFLGSLLQEHHWNASFQEYDGRVAVPNSGPPPSLQLSGGATITLLSPPDTKLLALRKAWTRALREAGMKPGDWVEAAARLAQRKEYKPKAPRKDVFAAKAFGSDSSAANGASIAFILEYQGCKVLFGADAHVAVLTNALHRLAEQQGVERVLLDAVKLPHHGSMANIDGEFLDVIKSPRFLVSTNGAHFGHPDPDTIRLLADRAPGAEIRFNYRSDTTQIWEDTELAATQNIRPIYPPDGQVLDLTL